jgi:hypothetical protein
MASYRSSSAPNTDRKVPSDAWCQAHTYLPPSIMPVWTHQDFVDDNKTGEISLTPMDRDGSIAPAAGTRTRAEASVAGQPMHIPTIRSTIIIRTRNATHMPPGRPRTIASSAWREIPWNHTSLTSNNCFEPPVLHERGSATDPLQQGEGEHRTSILQGLLVCTLYTSVCRHSILHFTDLGV